MKLRIVNFCMTLLVFFPVQIKPSHPVFGFAPSPDLSLVDSAHQSSSPSLATENPFNIPHDENSLPVPSSFESKNQLSNEDELNASPIHTEENPFHVPAAPVSLPQHESQAPLIEQPHTQAQVGEHGMATDNHLMPSAKTDLEPHFDAGQISHSEEHSETHVIPGDRSTKSLSHEHLSTVKRTASIPTLTITPGHSVKLAPLSGSEAQMHYVIQDKKYSSYLATVVTHGITEPTIAIPKTVHEGAFTVFKAEGEGVHPQSFQPAYHVTIVSTEMEGTQFSEEQTSSAIEKLNILENQYIVTMQEHFKNFMRDLRNVIDDAHKTGESLALSKPPVLQKITTHAPIVLFVGETKVLSSFEGGSAQSADPAVVAVALSFKGKREKPEWIVSLIAHKIGETTITYSTGTETFEQPVFVKSTSDTEKIMKEKKESSNESSKATEKSSSIVVGDLGENDADESIIPLEQEGALASFLRADEDLPGEMAAEEKEAMSSAVGLNDVISSDNTPVSGLEEKTKNEQKEQKEQKEQEDDEEDDDEDDDELDMNYGEIHSFENDEEEK